MKYSNKSYWAVLSCGTVFYAPINVNPVGGECGQGVGIWQILNFFDQIPQDGKRKVNQKCQKSPHPRGKNLNKQYYNTIKTNKRTFQKYVLATFI